MKLLILSQYFPPETGAPANRLMKLATGLKRKGVEVRVLTAMPNYPEMKVHSGYRGKVYLREELEGITVHRAWIFAGKQRSMLIRLINYFSFVITSLFTGLMMIRHQDMILCESPPLFLGISAWLLSVIKGSRLIFNVSDLWPESAERLGLVSNKLLLRMSTILEEFLYRKSFLVTGQTQGIVSNISLRFPGKPVYWLRNGVDMGEILSVPPDPEWRAREGLIQRDFLLVYAGIIGHAQGLEVILRAAEILHYEEHIWFLLIGNGPVLGILQKMKGDLKLDRVRFLSSRPRKEVIKAILASDAAIVPLRKLDLFKGAIPSKIFENLVLRKPVLLGIEGEACDLIIREGNAGIAFEPENPADLADKIIYLYHHPDEMKKLGENGYQLVQRGFQTEAIVEGFWNQLNHHYHAAAYS
jgi:glycosyltransferase involved in cell wall biosynthesis